MKVVIQTDYNFDWLNTNMYEAKLGFESMDYEVVKARDKFDLEQITKDEQAIVVGNVNFVRQGMKMQGIEPPEPIDYPDGLSQYYGRDIQMKPLFDVDFPAFVKPVKHKKFVGDLFLSKKDFKQKCFGDWDSNMLVWKSEQVPFRSEYRIFVDRKQGGVLGMRKYCGCWYLQPSGKILPDMVTESLECDLPVAYSIDVGLTDEWRTLIVEVNDAYALGNYGIEPLKYAKMLKHRWEELVE